MSKKLLWAFRILFGLSILVGTWFHNIMLVWALSGVAMLISLVVCLYFEEKITQSKSNANRSKK